MKKGDVILIPFPFTDLSGSKLRPAVVLIDLKYDVTVAFISSQMNIRESIDILLQPSLRNGLKKVSVLKLAKIATLRKDLITGMLGELDNEYLNLLDHNLKILFKLK